MKDLKSKWKSEGLSSVNGFRKPESLGICGIGRFKSEEHQKIRESEGLRYSIKKSKVSRNLVADQKTWRWRSLGKSAHDRTWTQLKTVDGRWWRIVRFAENIYLTH